MKPEYTEGGVCIALNQKWFEHLAPKEFHPFFWDFNGAYLEYMGRYGESGVAWAMSGMAGKPVKVKVGDPPPVFHFKLLKKCFICEFGHHHISWERVMTPPSMLKKYHSISSDSYALNGSVKRSDVNVPNTFHAGKDKMLPFQKEGTDITGEVASGEANWGVSLEDPIPYNVLSTNHPLKNDLAVRGDLGVLTEDKRAYIQHAKKFKEELDLIDAVNSDETKAISDTGFLLVKPVFRFELVTDPHLLDSMHSSDSFTTFSGKAKKETFRSRKVKEPTHIFTADVHHLLTNELHKLHPAPPKYTLYQHVFGNGGDYPDQGFFYVGITQRTWQKRWNEHKVAINRGSKLKFHKMLREKLRKGQITYINHKVMGLLDTIEQLYTSEEEVVDGYWEDERLLNMIPGGRKGIRYLHEHNMVDRKVHPLPDEVDRILENWFKENPRKGLPAPWIAEKWEDPDYVESVICGANGRLKPDQVRAIRHLSATGLEPEVILQKVGALNLSQVSRVLTGQSYSRIT